MKKYIKNTNNVLFTLKKNYIQHFKKGEKNTQEESHWENEIEQRKHLLYYCRGRKKIH